MQLLVNLFQFFAVEVHSWMFFLISPMQILLAAFQGEEGSIPGNLKEYCLGWYFPLNDKSYRNLSQ